MAKKKSKILNIEDERYKCFIALVKARIYLLKLILETEFSDTVQTIRATRALADVVRTMRILAQDDEKIGVLEKEFAELKELIAKRGIIKLA